MANEHVKPDTPAEDHITSIIVTVHHSNGKNDILELSYLAGCGVMKERRENGSSGIVTVDMGHINTVEMVTVHQKLFNLVDPFMLALFDATRSSLKPTENGTGKGEN